jgi:uncharacterized membrane protein YkvA (DUF1232 family)
MESKNNWLGPYIPQGSWLRELAQQVKLAYNLMTDARVHPATKLIPVAALAYLLLPIDLAPDVVLGLGQLDDLAVLMFGLRMFFEFAPPEVVQEHLKRLAQRVKGDWTVVDDASGSDTPPAGPSGGEVVDE